MWLTSKVMVPVSFAGLVAATELPLPSWAQFGLAGLSMFVLFFVLTRTHPREMKDLRESNERIAKDQRESNERIAAAQLRSSEETRDKFIELIQEQRGTP